MKSIDIIRSAVRNSFRNKLRTGLTVVAIFIGAFTLTITNGLGTGINAYIDSTVTSIGSPTVLAVSKTPEETTDNDIAEFDPNSTEISGPGPGGSSVEAITSADLDELRDGENIESVEPVRSVNIDFIRFEDGTAYVFSIGSFVPGMTLQLIAGEQPDSDSNDLQLALPVDYVETLGFDDAEGALDHEVELAVTTAIGDRETVSATIVGIAENSLVSNGAGTANAALMDELYDVQSAGSSTSSKNSFAQATVTFDESLTAEELIALRAELTDLGYDSETTDEQIGAFKSVIDGIILVLNAFAFIALLAAGFGIVNTLLMSVQERTREIGLMKAMGLSGRKLFGLFSFEAVFLGFLGSAIGSIGGILAGTVVSSTLAAGLLGDLPGLVLIAFTPGSVLGVMLLIMGIAFIAGTLPASRAARQNPIDALRYE
jgi:putative ABC transport system permease protein